MTDVIHLLPDSVANQIAAGEVIQRPASVIKELVENAVDAGAQTIHVLVVDAGRTSIQVIDDGCGMSETDARLAFERHATSKILQADDLFSLQTMGFRGEALPSIAAVAQVELRTRRAADEVGTSLLISASRVENQEPCSCSPGTSITVSNLFFNVPARRKFLKTNATELNNILTAFERIVLVYPSVNFTLHSNSQELDDDGRRDVGHDSQGEDGCIGECASREHVQKAHQAFAGLLAQSYELARVDAGKHHEGAEAVDGSETNGDQDLRAKILDHPYVLQCCKKLLHES